MFSTAKRTEGANKLGDRTVNFANLGAENAKSDSSEAKSSTDTERSSKPLDIRVDEFGLALAEDVENFFAKVDAIISEKSED